MKPINGNSSVVSLVVKAAIVKVVLCTLYGASLWMLILMHYNHGYWSLALVTGIITHLFFLSLYRCIVTFEMLKATIKQQKVMRGAYSGMATVRGGKAPKFGKDLVIRK